MLLSVALLAIGALLVVAGVAWLSPAAALVTTGVLLVGYALLRDAGGKA